MTIPSHDPRDPKVRRPAARSGISATMVLGLALGTLIALAVVWYATSNRTANVVNAPAFERSVPDSTTGQGRTNTMPGRDQNIPNPTPPAKPTPNPRAQ
jgi:hypothetical protein